MADLNVTSLQTSAQEVSSTWVNSMNALSAEEETSSTTGTSQTWKQRPRPRQMRDEEEAEDSQATDLVGMTFVSLSEAFEFYNLYSWQLGFGIRRERSRKNTLKTMTIQDIVCSCHGNARKQNSRSIRCGCPALMRLVRRNNGGWYVKEHISGHNHPMSETYAEKTHWRSHQFIDTRKKDLIKYLRSSNVNLSNVFGIVSGWTLNARDVLPPHLQHMRMDKVSVHHQTFRHSSLYINALEIVQLGDANVKAYEIAMKHMLLAKSELKDVASESDGHAQVQEIENSNSQPDATMVQEVDPARLIAPQKAPKKGRPSNSRDKPPYEQPKKKRKGLAMYCDKSKKNQDEAASQNPEGRHWKQVTCSGCLLKGHNKSSCSGTALNEIPKFQFMVPPELHEPLGREDSFLALI